MNEKDEQFIAKLIDADDDGKISLNVSKIGFQQCTLSCLKVQGQPPL